MPRLTKILLSGLLTLLVFPSSAHARQRASGWCERGGQSVQVTNGLTSITKVQASYPQCTVTVYLTGTVTLATLYSDNSGTSKANPFTSSTTGYWFFYANDSRYDVVLSGGGLASPLTLGDISLGPLGATDMVSVRGYGATGDGSTNDRAAIQAAFDAAGANGVVYFPEGDYKISTGLTCYSGLTIRGDGAILRAGADGITMISCSGASLQYVRIYGLRFVGADFSGANTLTGISLSSGATGQNSTRHILSDLVFDNVRYAIKLDKVSDSKIENIHLWNNSTIFSGSTTTGASDYAHNNTLSHITHYATAALAMSDPIITLTRAATNTVSDFYARNLYGTNKGILINGDSQAVQVFGGNIVSPSIGIDIDCSAPGAYWTSLTAVKVDQAAITGIKVGASCLYTSISQPLITGKSTPWGTEQHGIYIGQNSYGTQVISPTVQNLKAGAGITADAGASGFKITGGYYANVAPVVDIQLISGAVNYTVAHNVQETGSTATFMSNATANASGVILGNNSLSDQIKNNFELRQTDPVLALGNPGAANTPKLWMRSSGANATFDGQFACVGGSATQGKGNCSVTAYTFSVSEYLTFSPKAFADLGTPADGFIVYCNDCTIASPCAGSGTGALAKRLNGIWVCN